MTCFSGYAVVLKNFLFTLIIISFYPSEYMSQPSVIAHRGASGYAPENTIAAFKLALDSNADFIELDVHLSKDGELVVMHDETVNRTTNGKGKIKELNWDQIRNLDAGSWFSDNFIGTKVPALQEVFQWSGDKLKMLIEIKGDPEKYKGLEQKLIAVIVENNAAHRCIVQSFNLKFLKNIHNLNPHIELHYLIIGRVFSGKIPAYIKAINPNYRFVTRKKIEKLHSMNKKIFTWTVNDDKIMKKLISFGVDGIITNYPGKLASLVPGK